MSNTVVPFPRANLRALSAAASASSALVGSITSELNALEQFMASTGRALDDLRTTETLINEASEAIESGKVDDMVAIRDVLAARIAKRQADCKRRTARARHATR